MDPSKLDRDAGEATQRQVEVIDLARADDPRDVIHRAVAVLVRGGVLMVPTSDHLALAASALRPAAVERVARIRGEERPLSLAIAGAGEIADWIGDVPAVAARLARRLWPGPVTFLFPTVDASGICRRLPEAVISRVQGSGHLGLRTADLPLTHEVLRLVPGPLVMARIDPQRSDDLLRQAQDVDMILDPGPRQVRSSGNAVIRIDRTGWTLQRPRALTETEVVQASCTGILFVCTGNTCRSPMAEALFKVMLAQRLRCSVDELPAKGFLVGSAGLSATLGARAASHAQEIAESAGGSLRRHASRPVTERLLDQSDHILTMTHDHLAALLDHFPEVTDRARMLDPLGQDVDDPIGADLATYRTTARQIEEYLAAFLNELRPESAS